jgi:MFS superfamily sulfate permease-like transporter
VIGTVVAVVVAGAFFGFVQHDAVSGIAFGLAMGAFWTLQAVRERRRNLRDRAAQERPLP